MKISAHARLSSAALSLAVETTAQEVCNATCALGKKISRAAHNALNALVSPRQQQALAGRLRQLKAHISTGAQQTATAIQKNTQLFFRKASNLAGAIASRIEKTVGPFFTQARRGMSHLIKKTLPRLEPKRIREDLVRLSTDLAHRASSWASDVEKAITATARSVSTLFNKASLVVANAARRVATSAENIATACLDDLIPSRRRAREWQNRAVCLHLQLKNSQALTRGFADSAETQRARAEHAEARVTESLRQVQQLSREGEDRRAQAERDAQAHAASLERAAQRVRDLECEMEHLHRDQLAAVAAPAERAPSPAVAAVEADDSPALPAPVDLPEGGIEEASQEEAPAASVRHARKRRSHRPWNNGLRAPSLKVCLQGSGYPKR